MERFMNTRFRRYKDYTLNCDLVLKNCGYSLLKTIIKADINQL